MYIEWLPAGVVVVVVVVDVVVVDVVVVSSSGGGFRQSVSLNIFPSQSNMDFAVEQSRRIANRKK